MRQIIIIYDNSIILNDLYQQQRGGLRDLGPRPYAAGQNISCTGQISHATHEYTAITLTVLKIPYMSLRSDLE